jgi:hypothetical protein
MQYNFVVYLLIDLIPIVFIKGHHVITISAQIKGTKEKKYSLTTLLNVGSAIAPNKKSIEITSPMRTATKESTVT